MTCENGTSINKHINLIIKHVPVFTFYTTGSQCKVKYLNSANVLPHHDPQG